MLSNEFGQVSTLGKDKTLAKHEKRELLLTKKRMKITDGVA